MSTRERRAVRLEDGDLYQEYQEPDLDLESLSDEELEEFLFKEEAPDEKSPLNIPTIAGLSMILVGIVYFLQQLDVLGGVSLSTLVEWIPWLAGILIILVGFGVLSWKPSKKRAKQSAAKRRKARKKSMDFNREVRAAKAARKAQTTQGKPRRKGKKRLRKSRDRVISGVCSGLGDYLGVDPTIIRILFVIGTIVFGAAPIVYLVLAVTMSAPEKKPRVTDGQSLRIGE